jgi:hypothetical protein
LLNKDGEVDIGPSLREFKEFTTPLPSDVRYPAAALACLGHPNANSASPVGSSVVKLSQTPNSFVMCTTPSPGHRPS